MQMLISKLALENMTLKQSIQEMKERNQEMEAEMQKLREEPAVQVKEQSAVQVEVQEEQEEENQELMRAETEAQFFDSDNDDEDLPDLPLDENSQTRRPTTSVTVRCYKEDIKVQQVPCDYTVIHRGVLVGLENKLKKLK